MVQALVTLDDETNKVINIVKAKHDFKDKGQAISFIVRGYAEEQMEPELRPDFIQKMLLIEKQKSIPVSDFAKRYGLK